MQHWNNNQFILNINKFEAKLKYQKAESKKAKQSYLFNSDSNSLYFSVLSFLIIELYSQVLLFNLK